MDSITVNTVYSPSVPMEKITSLLLALAKISKTGCRCRVSQIVPCRACVATNALDVYAVEDEYAVAKVRAMVPEPPPYSSRYSLSKPVVRPQETL